jgi:hypothetical protein
MTRLMPMKLQVVREAVTDELLFIVAVAPILLG